MGDLFPRIDLGSAKGKAIDSTRPDEPVVFDNYCAITTPEEYAAQAEMAAYMGATIPAIETEEEIIVFGEAARSFTAKQYTGTARYEEDNHWYYRALFQAVLLSLYGHRFKANVLPTFSLSLQSFQQYKNDMENLLDGTHKIRWYRPNDPDRWHVYRVYTRPEEGEPFGAMPETVGAILHEIITPDGIPSSLFNSFTADGAQTLCFDFGGRTLDTKDFLGILPGKVTLSYNAGIIDITDKLEELLKSRLRAFDTNFDHMLLARCLVADNKGRHFVNWQGEPVDITREVDTAVRTKLWIPFVDQVLPKMDLGLYGNLLFTGGASYLLRTFIGSEIKRKGLRYVRKNEAHLGNLYGMHNYRNFQVIQANA